MNRAVALKFLVAFVCFFALTASLGCGNVEEDAVPRATSATVTIFDFKFKPQELRISKGTKVTWINKDRVEHNVTADSGDFDEIMDPGGKFSHTFERAGSFRYKDRLNAQPGLVGKIIVE